MGSVLILTLVSIVVLLLAIGLLPSTAHFDSMPGPKEWYLYAGGVLGVAILAAPILLVPRIGTTFTLVAIVMGQLIMALLIDHFGLFASLRIAASLPRIVGIGLVALGAILVASYLFVRQPGYGSIPKRSLSKLNVFVRARRATFPETPQRKLRRGPHPFPGKLCPTLTFHIGTQGLHDI